MKELIKEIKPKSATFKFIQKYVLNKYFVTIFLFLVWMVFFDNTSFLVVNELNGEINKYEEQLAYYKSEYQKNDEFYTQLTDIEQEMQHYRPHFKNKTIYLNCDTPEWSKFFVFFALNFTFLGLKKLITTHYNPNGPSFKYEIDEDINNDGRINLQDAKKTDLF